MKIQNIGEYIMKFIVALNMPDKMIYKLETFGEVYKGSKLNIEDESVSYHPDMQIHFLNDNFAICPEEVYDYYRKSLPDDIKLLKGFSVLGITYPENCAYNIARVGNSIICNEKISDTKIIDYYKEHKFNIINVKQGYAKCNIAPLCDDLFITEDEGIYKIAVKSGLKPILIPKGYICLEGFDYGFIGGATGLINNKLLFCGCVPDSIKVVLERNFIEYIELSDDKLTDYGSIISFG